ncbi:ATP-dependent DNA ligase [Nannocystaceae bacterium ST9]
MNRFAGLFAALDATTSTKAKTAAIVDYLASAPAADLAWALFFLSGRRFKRLVGARELMAWLEQACGLPMWLIEDSLAVVGDFAETAALLLEARARPSDPDEAKRRAALSEVSLADWVETKIEPLRELDEPARRAAVVEWWRLLPRDQVFLLGKLLTGELRVGVSTTLVVRAVAEHADLTSATATARLMGEWRPSPEFVADLFAPEGEAGSADDLARPYPFFLASPIEGEPADALGELELWQAEWKWDGIRGQLIRRGETIAIWSRGEERIEQRFPELVEAAAALPSGLVLDGEVLAWDLDEDRPLAFAALQRRLNRKQVGKKLLAEVPVAFVVFDVIEHAGQDLRERPLAERRVVLETLCAAAPDRIRASPTIAAASWSELATLRASARERHVEGMMLKRLDSSYGHGRRKGPWWKWKIDPLTIDAVLVYAQAGSGRRANLFTDYTFAVWSPTGEAGRELVTIAKAYSGLTDDELRKLDKWIRAHTLERFGPVRQVEPVHVFELAFEGIAKSTRHKSGVAVRFPRILRWREDKPAEQADTLASLQALIDPQAPSDPE